MIEAKAATLQYEDHGRQIFACKDVDLTVHPGEFLGILGPSGSGKSSLLYLLSGLKTPTSGEVIYQGRSIHERSDEERAKLRLSEFGFVFQLPYLVGYLSAKENVMVAASGRDSEAEANELLDRLGLEQQKRRLPHELSGGQRQRVCVARALAGGRTAIFADEPTASLDAASGRQVVELLIEHRGAGCLVMVTHDEEMVRKADRIVTIREGRLG